MGLDARIYSEGHQTVLVQWRSEKALNRYFIQAWEDANPYPARNERPENTGMLDLPLTVAILQGVLDTIQVQKRIDPDRGYMHDDYIDDTEGCVSGPVNDALTRVRAGEALFYSSDW